MKAASIQGDPFRDFVEAIVSGDNGTAIGLLDASPPLANERAAYGATRRDAKQSFFDRIQHYMYEGDTALHMAAAAYQTFIAEELIARGSDVRARNRRGAEPLHYAVDGGPGLPAWNSNAQIKIIATLIRAGADPNAVDKSGVRSVAPRSAQSLRCCRKSAHRWWCRSAGPQQERLDTDASCNTEHRPRWFSISCVEGPATRDFASSHGARSHLMMHVVGQLQRSTHLRNAAAQPSIAEKGAGKSPRMSSARWCSAAGRFAAPAIASAVPCLRAEIA